MKKQVNTIIFLCFMFSIGFGQVNLVINPSFENLSICPDNFAQISRATGWDTLRNGGGVTPDLYNICYTGPYNRCSVPVNWWSDQNFLYPKSGYGYAGFYSFPDFREFIQGTLSEKLKMNNLYCLKAYLNLSDFSKYSINSLGFYFDNGQISCQWNALPNITPQVFHTGIQLNDTANWMRIEGVFTANGTEEFITIGNFFPDSLSFPVYFNPLGSSVGSYYYIDDVSVIPTNLPAYAGNDTLVQPGNSVFIGRQPEIGLDEDCIWFVNGLAIDTVAGMWVQPDSTTIYILEQTICGNVSWDTVTVSVYGTGIEGGTYGLNRGFRVYPNPATNLLIIESPISNGILSIRNLLGQDVLRLPISDKATVIDISKLGKGVYFVKIQTEHGGLVKRFLKE